MNRPPRLWPLMILLLCWTTAVHGLDLLTAYRAAIVNDAHFRAAGSSLEAAREALPLARAGFHPQINFTYQRTYNQTTNRQIVATGQTISRQDDYGAFTGVLSLRQPLYRRYNWAQLSLAEAQVAAAEATFEKDRQELALRVAGAYFEILVAQTNVDVLQAQLRALSGQETLAERAFAAGHGTRTDIDEARARLAQARAGLSVAERNLDNRRRLLGTMVGAVPQSIAQVMPQRLRDLPPVRESVEHWLQRIEDANPELAILRREFDAAAQDIERQRAGHYPTLDLVAARQHGSNESNISINVSYHTTYVGIQVTAPIYSGGAVSAQVRQARAAADAARHRLEAARHRLTTEGQNYYHTVVNGTDRVLAFEIALEAAERAHTSITRGVQAGTHTQVDVLNALQRIAESARAAAHARYEYLFSRLQLAAAAGLLTDETVAEVNAVLQKGALE